MQCWQNKDIWCKGKKKTTVPPPVICWGLAIQTTKGGKRILFKPECLPQNNCQDRSDNEVIEFLNFFGSWKENNKDEEAELFNSRVTGKDHSGLRKGRLQTEQTSMKVEEGSTVQEWHQFYSTCWKQTPVTSSRIQYSLPDNLSLQLMFATQDR